MLSERLLVHSRLFESNPLKYIKSLIGEEVTNVSYTVNDVIFPDNKIVVDVKYDKVIIPSLKTVYIDVSTLKRLGVENNKFIFEYNKIPICIYVSPSKLRNVKTIPVTIWPYTRNDTFYSYIARIKLEPLHAYSTMLSSEYNIDKVHAALAITKPEKVKELYDEKETINAYQNEISQFESMININNLKMIKKFNETKNSNAFTGFVMSYKILPDAEINGHIIIIEHRRSDLLFYYPNNSNMIYADEIQFIKEFMAFDESNLPKE